VQAKAGKIRISDDGGEVSTLMLVPDAPKALYVMAHGAGAGMQHVFMQRMAEGFASHKIATFRYMFPYMEAARRRPDHKNKLIPVVRKAVQAAGEQLPDLPLFAGGKSMGGRMTSQAHSGQPLPGVSGLVFLGFPLHPPKKPSTSRAEHLDDVQIPMLFLQGTRDHLADLELLRPVCDKLHKASLHIVEGGDHGFNVLKRSGRTQDEVFEELASVTARWCDKRGRSP